MIMQPMPDQHRLVVPSHTTHFLNSAAAMRRPPNFLQQMAIQQQQQLVHQLQLSQRQLMLQRSLPVQQDTKQATREDLAGLWRGLVAEGADLNTNVNCEKALGINGLLASMCINRRELTMNGNHWTIADEENHHEGNILYSSQGVCRWPSCEIVCEDYQSFIKHLNNDHRLDDRSTAQTRVQAQVVNQLELQLQSERDRLNAMMQHLHMFKQEIVFSDMDNETSNDMTYPNLTNASPTLYQMSQSTVVNVSQSQSITGAATTALISSTAGAINQQTVSSKSRNLHKNRRNNDASAGLPYMLERAGLDVQQEINRNREFYRNADVRPPFTYASLIRQSIIESPDKQLTLNEIYNWFQNTFCYFRRNAATWKNAIRTNLSLHKCFVRYEDDFGSFWMVDDAEFVKRRHLSRGRPRKYDPICSPNHGGGTTAAATANATTTTTTTSTTTTAATTATTSICPSTMTSSNSSSISSSSSSSNNCCTTVTAAVAVNETDNQIDECSYSKSSHVYNSNSHHNSNNCNSINNNNQNSVDDTYPMYSNIRMETPSPKRIKIFYDISPFTSSNEHLNCDNISGIAENAVEKDLASIDFNCNTSLESTRNADRENESRSCNGDRCHSLVHFDKCLNNYEEADEEVAEDLSMPNCEPS